MSEKEQLLITNYRLQIEDGNDRIAARQAAPHCWLLPVILLIAAVVRVWRLGSLPPALFRDEAEKALNGWFLLHYGVDAAGRPWPVFIEVFGVTTSAIYQYATIPFLLIGGLNEWSARLPAAVAAIMTVLFTWLLCRRVWGVKVAAWAAGMLAISPWHVPLSRWAQQGVFLPLLFVMAAWGVAEYLKLRITNYELRIEEDTKEVNALTQRGGDVEGVVFLMIAAACMAIGMYTYDPARLFAPLLGLTAVVIWWRQWVHRWRAVLTAILVFLFFASPVIWLLLTQSDAAQARFRHLSVFQPGVSTGEGLRTFAGNYLSHFSLDFLLFRGDSELRHSGGVGMLNITELLFAVAGGFIALRCKCRWGIFMILWILAAPVAASLTRIGVPHALRSQMALPAWQILAAVGIAGVATRLPSATQKGFYQIAILILLLGSLPFFISYFGSYSRSSAINWQYGVKQSLHYLNGPATDNSDVFFHNVVGAEYLAPFYLQMDRPAYQRMVRGAGRYHFLPFQFPDREPPANVSTQAAWVTPPGYLWPTSNFPIPISAPDGELLPPVMLIYLNQQLLDQVKLQSAK